VTSITTAPAAVDAAKPEMPTYHLDLRYPRFATLIDALDDRSHSVSGRAGLIVEDRTLTYAQYRSAVAGMAVQLRELGAGGGRVAVCMGNGLETAVALLGAMAAGAQAAPINPNYTDAEIVPLLRDVDPKVLLYDAAFAPRSAGLASALGIPHHQLLGPSGLSADRWAGGNIALPEPRPRREDPALMFFTGGSTGFPKGAPHTHAQLMAHAYAATALWPLALEDERILNVAPLFHVWGFCYSLVNPIYVAATMVLMPAFRPALVLEAMQRHRITVFAGGPPALYVGLTANENFGRTDFSALRYCLSGGAPCPEELLRSWERATGCALLEGIGMSEGAPIALNPMKGPRKIRSVGVPPPDTEVEIVDLETGTRRLPAGEAGEIRVRGPQFIRAYRNRPEESARAIRDGWLHTGDIGYFDEDGYLFCVDRKKEMILVGGFNVYPREVDEVLCSHPAVLEAATVGVPDSFSGEAVRSFVALRPGARASAAELDAYCRERLVKYKVPTAIVFLDALPKSSVGKIDKLKLKALPA
jgi:long-chain acyl-CoA synthetase